MTKTFKIETENGKLTCPELVGYELPEWKRKEEDVEAMAKEATKKYINEREKQTAFLEYIDGYNKAREKFEFSEIDLRQALSMAFIAIQDGGNITSDEIITSLRTAPTPIAIEVEMEPIYADDAFGETYQIGWQPALTPDGTVKVVNWIFNE